MVPEAAVSVAYRELPPVPPNLAKDATTIALMYQYVEPMWTAKQHKEGAELANRQGHFAWVDRGATTCEDGLQPCY